MVIVQQNKGRIIWYIITTFFLVDEFYSHKPNTYSYIGVNSYTQSIKLCTCIENVIITLFPSFVKH